MRTFALVAGAAALLAPAQPAGAPETPRTTIERAIKAHGGAERLSLVRADKVKLKGTLIAAGKAAPFTAYTTVQLPAQYKSVIELTVEGRKRTLVHLLNGDKALVTIDGQPTKVDPAALSELRETLQLDQAVRLVPLLADRGFNLAPLGEGKVNDRTVVGVKVTSRGRKELRMYFDKATGLLIKTEHSLDAPAGRPEPGAAPREVRQEEFYSDFKDLEGFRRPTKMVVLRDGRKLMEAELVEVKYFSKIDDAEFEKP
ncbi:MAG TPA: hypothetical protein VFE78_10390 [Gemmataceae bacterium]|jgi:hypothetical protein|nr:hypothetical protein [Gemmataceae bacterium]